MSTNVVSRLSAVYVADLVLVRHDGTEVLNQRKFYEKVGPAKSMRTRWASRHRMIGMMGWWSQFAGSRVDVYAITPTGYEVIP